MYIFSAVTWLQERVLTLAARHHMCSKQYILLRDCCYYTTNCHQIHCAVLYINPASLQDDGRPVCIYTGLLKVSRRYCSTCLGTGIPDHTMLH